MDRRALAVGVVAAFVGLGCQGPEGPPVSGVPGPSEPGLARIEGALTVGGCECKSWQPGVKCHEITYSDIPPDNRYYVTTFGGPGDGQDMWICGHKKTDNGSWPYAAGYARFGCTKIKVIAPATGKSCIAEVADCGPNRCVEEAACFCNCQGHHPILDVSPFITKHLFGISSSGWSEKREVVAYPVDPATPIGCPGGPEPVSDQDGDGFLANQDCDDSNPSVHPGAPEACNARDDDCDGQEDEGLARPCATECGSGTETCSNGQWVHCTALQPLDCMNYEHCQVESMCVSTCPAGPAEVCNGRDEDCDGQKDEGLARPCATECGSGTETCSNGQWVHCTAPQPLDCLDATTCEIEPVCASECPPPPAETCDGLDNDCDGETDEEFPERWTVCSAGQGGCLRFGLVRCTPDGAGVECGAVAGEPSQEVCDGLDNDCDGLVDDAVCVACVPGEVRPCTMPDGGPGLLVCGQEAVFGPCAPGEAAPPDEAPPEVEDDAGDAGVGPPEDVPSPRQDIGVKGTEDRAVVPDEVRDLGEAPAVHAPGRGGGCRSGPFGSGDRWLPALAVAMGWWFRRWWP